MIDREHREWRIDKWIHDLSERQLQLIGLVVLVILSVIIRIHLAPFCQESPDYYTYYATWVEQYRHLGIVKGLSTTIGDYYVPINVIYAIISLFPWEPWVLIAAVSCLFEYITVIFLYRIIMFLSTGQRAKGELQIKAAYAAVAVLFLPCSMWNSALWKQCDSIYTCFAIIALYYLIQDRYRMAVIFLGISLSFKLQAVILIPVFGCVYLIKRRYSLLHFLWLPVVYLIAGFPAVILHRGLRATYLTYLGQMQEGTSQSYGLNSYFPNLYAFGLDQYYHQLALPAVLLAIAFLGSMLLLVYHYREQISADRIIYLAILSAWTCCVFLPGMHERYDYVVLLLLTIYALTRDHKLIPAAILINFCSMLTYTMVLFKGQTLPLMMIGLLYLLAYLYAGGRLIYMMRNQVQDERNL